MKGKYRFKKLGISVPRKKKRSTGSTHDRKGNGQQLLRSIAWDIPRSSCVTCCRSTHATYRMYCNSSQCGKIHREFCTACGNCKVCGQRPNFKGSDAAFVASVQKVARLAEHRMNGRIGDLPSPMPLPRRSWLSRLLAPFIAEQ